MRLLNKNLILLAVLSLAPAQGFAGDDDEYIEVTAPNECCGDLPSGLGILVGWSGGMGGIMAAGGMKAAAMKYATKQAFKQKENRKNNKDKAEQQSEYDDATTEGSGESAAEAIAKAWKEAVARGHKTDLQYKSYYPNGQVHEELTLKDCTDSGVFNPKNPCTQQKLEIFTDPTDGKEKWALTLSIVRAVYNPKHLDADAQGWAPQVIDGQTLSIVFESVEDLVYQLVKISRS